MNTNVLFIGDPHFKIKNVETIPLFCSKILNILNSRQIDFVVLAGDLLDNHEIINVEPYNLAVQFVKDLSEKAKTFVLVGNHDYKNNQQFLTSNHWMNAMKQWGDNVIIVDEVVLFGGFVFAPYVPPGRFVEALESLGAGWSSARAIFAHQEFYGCKMGSIESTIGDKWDLEWPIVISGHIHNKQWPQKNIYYPGSAMQHAFGQSVGNTVSILNFHNNEMTYEEIDLKMPKLYIKYLNVRDMDDLSLKITSSKKYKLVVDGMLEEFKVFKKTSRYKELLSEGFKIVFKASSTQQELVELLDEKKTFINILQEKIDAEKDPELTKIYASFFLWPTVHRT
ncbi:DNA repair exonuclease SbcCD D subunit [Chloriridovirus anopheles1]|uniref:DNA repair exonuclease SbcCD D subunit n=1 Tax=Chloriridovirus anopheles1 TaxID=1465751 RepID=W8QF75_9VIRU|nr:DNA repair exonuclease SbcCD D subunit [Anopheles minimus iridovirus]AHL67629.1 DNA repair exonuclease SbcCD D subunit [Anopheles minimus iridovirus]